MSDSAGLRLQLSLNGSSTGLRATALHAVEGISMPFVFTVDFVSGTQNLSSDSVLAKPGSVTLTMPDGTVRIFHGIVRSWSEIGSSTGREAWRYRLELVPQLWFCSQTATTRIFEKMTVVDIMTQLFTNSGVTQSSFSINADKVQRDYTVQWNETDLDFMTRLMEEEGYYYYFTHSSSGHTLCVTDNTSGFTAVASGTVTVQAGATDVEKLSDLSKTTVTVIGNTALGDYDPLNPSTAVSGTQATILTASAAAQRTVFAWPAQTASASVAGARAKARQEAAEAFATLLHGAGQHAGFIPGTKFTVSDDVLNGASASDYMIRSVVHEAHDDLDVSGAGMDGYSNTFTAFPAAVVWRQPLSVPRPHMTGIHAAIVLGDSGDEITTDDNARVKVQFYWDQAGTATSDNTVWVRVMTPWAGNTWGWQSLPRVGTEVGVAFVDGDPDHPIVVGALYNANMMPVFAKSDKNKSGLRTRSTTGGGTANFSEFSFDDTMGSEVVFLHAEKDLKIEVENDATIDIKHDETITIGNDQSLTITNSRTTEIKQADDQLTLDKGNLTVTVTAGKITTEAKGNIATTSDTGDITSTATAGNVTIEATAGSVTITAGQSITLKVGDNQIAISNTGIDMKGMMFSAKADLTMDLKGLMATYAGQGMTALKGPLTQIGS